jgi:hypothetical protein
MAAEPLLAAKRATENTESHRKAIDSIRTRTDLTAKGLAVIGTAAVSAVGYAKFADLFPYGGPAWAVALLAVGVGLMILSFISLSRRFSSASEAVFTSPNLQTTIDRNSFDAEEEQTVRTAYDTEATLNEVGSLLAYQARGHRFQRIADRLEPDDKLVDSLRARADLVMAEVQAVQVRVGALILKNRAKDATIGKTTGIWILAFIAGWYITAFGADKLESERSGQIEVAKTCAEARKAGAGDGDLPRICGKASGGDEEPASAATSINTSAVSVAEAKESCRTAARKAKEDPSVCAPLQAALAALNGEGPS